MAYQFTAVFEKNSGKEGNGYTAYIQEIPAAISEGDTLDEARENVLDALKLVLEANPDLAFSLNGSEQVIKELVTLPAA